MSTTSKRLLGILVALFILIYVGMQAFRYFFTDIDLQTCQSYTVYDSIDVKGIAIRSEEILEQTTNGYVYYTLENGARVAKDGVIAEIYPSDDDAFKHKKLLELNREISNLQQLQQLGSISKTNLETLNSQINKSQTSLILDLQSGDFTDLLNTKSQLMEYLNRKQILTAKVLDFEEYISKLEKEKEGLENSASSTGTITSPQPGYFVSSLDGYESVLSYDNVNSLTVTQINKLLDQKSQMKPQNSVGKVVSNYEWYIACIVPTDRLSEIGEGTDLSVRLPFVSDETIPAEVVTINRDKDKAAIILKCSYMSEALSSVRCEEIQILLKEYSGLYVPDEALQFDKENNPGVFVCAGTTLEFRRISILYHSDVGKYSICDATMGQAKLTSKKPSNNSEDSTVSSNEESDVESSQNEDVSEIEESSTSSTPEESEETTNKIKYLKLYDDIVTGGKDLYEGKIVR